MYVKAHPFGYKKIQAVNRNEHSHESIHHIQTVVMSNGQIRTIKHYCIRSGSLI